MIFQVGNLNSNTGEIDSISGTRLASEFVYLYSGTTIDSTNYEFVVFRYNASKEYISTVSSWTRNATITNDGYYRLTVRIYNSESSSVIGKEVEAQTDIKVKPLLSENDYSYYEKLILSSLKSCGLAVSPYTYSSILPNANNANKNTIYRLAGFAADSTEIPLNLPYSKWQSEWLIGILISIGNTEDNNALVQLYITMSAIYIRPIRSGSW